MKHGNLVAKDHLFGQIFEFPNSIREPHVNWWGVGYEYIPPDELLERVSPDQIPNHLRHFVTGGVYVGGEFFSEDDVRNLIAIAQQIQLNSEKEFDFAEAVGLDIYRAWSELTQNSEKEAFIIDYANYIRSVYHTLTYAECLERARYNIRYWENI